MSHPFRLALALSGPALVALGYAFHPDLPSDVAAAIDGVSEVRTRYLLSKLGVAAGCLLFTVTVLLVHRSLRGHRGGALAGGAAVLCTVGFVCNALSQTHFAYLLWYAGGPDVDRASGVVFLEAAEGAPILPTLPVSYLSVPLMAAGLLVLAAALWRSGLVPRWVPAALVIANVGSGVFPIGPAQLALGALMVAVFAVVLNSSREPRIGATVSGWPVSQSR